MTRDQWTAMHRTIVGELNWGNECLECIVDSGDDSASKCIGYMASHIVHTIDDIFGELSPQQAESLQQR